MAGRVKFDDWDPMAESYNNKNTLKRGTLSGDVSYAKNKGGSFSVVVQNISPQAGEAGIRNLFSKVGNVTNVSINPKHPKFETLMGFVSFKTSQDAERAIERFHNKMVFGYSLRVMVQLSAEERALRKRENAAIHSTLPSSAISPGISGDDNASEASIAPIGMGRGRRSEAPTPKRSDNGHTLTQSFPPPRRSMPNFNSCSSETNVEEPRSVGGLLTRAKPVLSPLKSPPKPKPVLDVGKVAEVFVHIDTFSTPLLFGCALKNPAKLKIDERYKPRQPSSLSRLSPDDMVAAPFDNVYYRGRVVSRGRADDEFLVSFVDYGNEAFVSKQVMHQLDPEDAAIPPMFLKLTLNGATEDNKDVYIAALQDMLGANSELKLKGRILSFDPSQDAFIMEFPLEDEKSVSAPLSPRKAIDEKSALQSPPEIPNLMPGSKIKVFVDLDTSDFENLKLNAQVEDPKQLMAVIEFYSKPTTKPLSPNARPPIGAMLAAPYQGGHYRALLKEHVGPGELRVFFVDYGNEEVISLDHGNVFNLEKRFIDLCPALFLKICLEGLAEGNKKAYMDKVLEGYVEKPGEQQLPLEGVVRRFDPDTKVCLLDIGVAAATKKAGDNLSSPSYLAKWVKKETECLVTEAPSADLLVVCPCELEEELNRFTDVVDSYGRTARPVDRVRPGQLVIAPFMGRFYRGIVNEVDEETNSAKIYFIDYGNVGMAPVAELRGFGSDAQNITKKEPFAVACRIGGMLPLKSKDDFLPGSDACNRVISLVSGVPVFVRGIRVIEDPLYGRMLMSNLSKSDLPSLALALIQEGLAAPSPAEDASSTSPCKASPSAEVNKEEKFHPLLEDLECNPCSVVSNKWIEMVSLNNTSPGFFTLVRKSDTDRLDDLSQKITQEVINDRSSTPIAEKDIVAGSLVIAKYTFDGHEAYYRASVRRISRQHKLVEVIFVDFGNIGQVDLKYVFPIPPEFMKEPIIPLYCTLSGIKLTTKFPADIKKRMDHLLLKDNVTVNVRVVELAMPESSSSPMLAVVEAQVSCNAFGSTPLMDALMSTPTKISKSPNVEQSTPPPPAPLPLLDLNDSEGTTGIIEKQRTIIVKDSPKCNGTSSDLTKKDLEKRVSSLESEVSECQRKIFTLEGLLVGLLETRNQ